MTPIHITVEQLIALRLLSAKAKGETKASISKALAVFFQHRLSNSVWRDRLEQGVVSLLQGGVLEALGKARYKLTTLGLEQNHTFLGYLPKKTPWQSLKNIDLMVKILQLPTPSPRARQQLGLADGLRGIILKQHYALPIPDYPTLTQARDALLWQKAFDPKRADQRAHKARQKIGSRYTLTAVIGIIVSDLLDSEQTLEPKNAVNQLIAKIVGASRTEPSELRLALLRNALTEPVVQPPDDSAGQLGTFATQVKTASQTCETGHFGEDKVFISHVYAHMVQHQALNLTLQQFKQRLAEANNQRLLSLAQADLVPAMDPQDVQASEMHYLTSAFHFIRR